MRAASGWQLWSTTARLVVEPADRLDEAVAMADRELARIDEVASRFRSDSELNRVAGSAPGGVRVSPLLALLVGRGIDAALLTDGLVDPTLGHTLNRLGYDRDIELIEDEGELIRAVVRTRPGWRSVSLVGDVLTVPSHLALDLGATAKAVAADRVAATIAEELECSVLLSLGGDIATAGPEPEGGWHVLVQDGPDEPAATVRLRAGSGLATSSTLHRRWMRGGRSMHHIVDPRTGLPAGEFWRTVTVSAESCFVANALATASIVRGAEALSWLNGRGAARLVDETGRVRVVGGWPVEQELQVHRG